jgi:hypothetical protein
VQEMEDCWPSGVGCLGAGAKPPCAALAEDRRGERQGEGAALIASGGDREDVPEAPGRVAGRALLRRRYINLGGIETGGSAVALGMSLAGRPIALGQAVLGVEAA